ncbi:hypothetical protein scyTo_0007144 [Scyliorhinus torazame]|uniref:Uncharacterized protein n=1 Tax=Scyliorhinus torazame TaxID=75743 RepID=A0A401NM80_SCYTO|nr:hypothetical protein [Scyliorhinus torazame]
MYSIAMHFMMHGSTLPWSEAHLKGRHLLFPQQFCSSSDFRPPLRRGSSFTFLTPGPWDFTLKRKRRAKDDDVVSLCSLDIKVH